MLKSLCVRHLLISILFIHETLCDNILLELDHQSEKGVKDTALCSKNTNKSFVIMYHVLCQVLLEMLTLYCCISAAVQLVQLVHLLHFQYELCNCTGADELQDAAAAVL